MPPIAANRDPPQDLQSMTKDQLIDVIEAYKMDIAEFRSTLQQKDEIIAKLRMKVFTLKSQMQVERELSEAQRRKVEGKQSELTANLVQEVELDEMTQNWLATEFTSAANAIIDAEEEEEDPDYSNTGPEETPREVDDSLPSIQEDTTTDIHSESRCVDSLSRGVTPYGDNAGSAEQIASPNGMSRSNTGPMTETTSETELSGLNTGRSEKRDRWSVIKRIRRASRATLASVRFRKQNQSVSFSNEIVPQIPAGVIDQLRDPSFDIFSKSYSELKQCILYMFLDLRLVDVFMIRPSVLHNFLGTLELHYKPNPYHNFRHAIDVAQTVYSYIIRTNARDILQPLDVLGLMLASLGHDVGHPGQNNAFQINTQSELARIYNDTSVLESYHAAKTFEILRLTEYPKEDIEKDPKIYVEYISKKNSGEFDNHPLTTNVLQSLSSTQFKEIRKNMINMILSTDMSKHFEMTAKLSNLVKKFETDGESLSSEKREDREFLCSVMLHCADISNVTKKFDIGKSWADCVRDEFYQQGDYEKMFGLPVSPYMDREDSNQARTTLNFIDFVATPLFSSLSIMIRGLEDVSSNLVKNREQWQDVLEMQLSEPTQSNSTQSKSGVETVSIQKAAQSPAGHNTATNQVVASNSSQEKSTKLLDTREFEKQAYRRRSILVMQKVNEADEAAKRMLGRGNVPKNQDFGSSNPALSIPIPIQKVINDGSTKASDDGYAVPVGLRSDANEKHPATDEQSRTDHSKIKASSRPFSELVIAQGPLSNLESKELSDAAIVPL
eukprot:TRINITY_DN5987_c0_g1_i10.p1 TRINITY_DN5987_c0_g1~~TRINITY_DN5987_c0_g1_i10.p1  ORF type:complete len:782 (-),score=148.76 TRINITY_DN5987_c0_g1_i10:488-2833(-)